MYFKRLREFLVKTKWKVFFWAHNQSFRLFIKLDTYRFKNVEFKYAFDKEALEINKRLSESICKKSGMCASKDSSFYSTSKSPSDMPITEPPIHPANVEVPFSSVTKEYLRSFEESCTTRELTEEELEASRKAIEEINGKI